MIVDARLFGGGSRKPERTSRSPWSYLSRAPTWILWACCVHAQQAAEKALKAVLVAQGAEPPFIHNLVALQALMPWDLGLDATVAELADLSASARGESGTRRAVQAPLAGAPVARGVASVPHPMSEPQRDRIDLWIEMARVADGYIGPRRCRTSCQSIR